jgi:hypothetical protein
MFFDNLLQVRIEFFTVRAVVVGKHHQGELWVFRADARGVGSLNRKSAIIFCARCSWSGVSGWAANT